MKVNAAKNNHEARRFAETMRAVARRRYLANAKLSGLPNVVSFAFLATFSFFVLSEMTRKSPWLGRFLRGEKSRPPPWIKANAKAFNAGNVAQNAKNLIMVATHAVTISGHLHDADRDERDWFLFSYQQNRGIPQAIVAHISAGIEAARRDPESLLVLSGGETRPTSGPGAEGVSYFHVADAMGLWSASQSNDNDDDSVRARTTAEEFATDSFENLLFSICRFYEVTGRYPEKITVVSFSFKEERFSTLHAPALRWQADRFFYIGIDPDESTGFNLEESTRGEKENAATPYRTDPYGCHSAILKQKRQQRNPYFRTPPYELSCPDMSQLLHFCGPELIPVDHVPWK